jgi:hypothetical protein
MRRLATGIRYDKCDFVVVRTSEYTYTKVASTAYYTPRLYGIAYKPAGHVAVLNTAGSCNTVVLYVIL